MDYFPLLELPKDIISLLLNNYFGPVTALRCLRVCKKLNELGDRSKIIADVLKFKMEEEYKRQFNELIICPYCSVRLDNKGSFNKHLNKHKRSTDTRFGTGEKFQKTSCCTCGVSRSNMTIHICLLERRSCYAVPVQAHEWLDSLCTQKWYTIDPNFGNHKCSVICKFCKIIFKTTGRIEDILMHFVTCHKRDEIVRIYRLKGDRSHKEWIECLDVWSNIPNEEKFLFEKEYSEWKSKNLKNLKTPNFLQKPY